MKVLLRHKSVLVSLHLLLRPRLTAEKVGDKNADVGSASHDVRELQRIIVKSKYMY